MNNNPTGTSAPARPTLNFTIKDSPAVRKNLWTLASCLCAGAMAAMFLCSCATTAIKSTWKSPNFQGGPVQKVAVLAVAERGIVRTGLEYRFAKQLEKDGQPAVITLKILSLPEIKENKDAAAARLREAGADSVLITRLVDKSIYDSQPGNGSQRRRTPDQVYSVIVGSPSEGWHSYYLEAYSGASAPRSESKNTYLLDTSLFDLNTGKRLWSCLTETDVKENADKFEIADDLVAKVVELMRKDGMVR